MNPAAAEPGSAVISRGLVALGDSITRASGEAMLGLRMQSWALWLAEALHLPFTCLAVNGARARDALADQAPELRGPYDLGCVYLGVNDVRAPDWQPEEYRDSLSELVSAVAGQSHLQLLVKLPRTIGRPPAPHEAIEFANQTITMLATRHGALTIELESLQGSEMVLPDAVHLTARGEARLAELAATQVAQAGLAVELSDIREALEPLSARAALRYATGPGALARARDWRRRVREQTEREVGRLRW